MNILISGSSKGIGLALVRHYIALGHHVSGCSRTPSSFTHERYRHFAVDVTDEAGVMDMMLQLQAKGGLDVLINNAGIASMNHFITTPVSRVKEIFEVNVFGAFLLMREAAKLMIPQKQGRIVNMLSIATPLHLSGEAAYGASKAALEHLTRTASVELAAYGITVNGVGSTPVQTDLIKNVPSETMQQLLNRQAIPRYAEMLDIQNAIDFFLRKESDFITGQVLYLGGVF